MRLTLGSIMPEKYNITQHSRVHVLDTSMIPGYRNTVPLLFLVSHKALTFSANVTINPSLHLSSWLVLYNHVEVLYHVKTRD